MYSTGREGSTVTAAPSDVRLPRTAVVADPDAGRLAANAQALRNAGYTVLEATDDPGLAGLLAAVEPSVIVADASLSSVRSKAPVLVMVDLDNPKEIAAANPPGVHDCITKPPAPKELVHRASALIDQVRRRSASRQEAEGLREQLREVSAAVRATNDPQEIANHVVSGFGRTFKADHVVLATFEDHRVPVIRAAWHRRGLAALPPEALPGEDTARATADALWAGTETLSADGTETGSLAYDKPVSAIAGAASTLAVPIGEGNSSLGIIWIAAMDRTRTWSSAELGLIQHVAGNAAYGLIQSHLISSQQQVVKQLRELDKAKTDFLATVNHELRTPLTSIMAYLDMIQESTEHPVSREVHQMLDIVVRNTERLRTLIEDMLSVSRGGLDTLEMHLAPVRLGRTLDLVAAALRPLATLQNVTIDVEPVPEDPEILADEVQLQQVFTNLVSNAIKFTPSGGRIAVGSESHATPDGSKWATVRISDTGIGISSDEINHVFTRFYRASNAMNGAIPGTGLGLAISKDIVDRHGGRIDVDSTLGTGTTVTVSLPLGTDRALAN
ncbi:ATP-binding protein [Pseudarthrobacter sp. NPDC080039]|uniref:ATP-binding protein n=1 Tax=unclassified Pseudarthrobacter TaxID=2647000 RepID=UPI00344BD962